MIFYVILLPNWLCSETSYIQTEPATTSKTADNPVFSPFLGQVWSSAYVNRIITLF